jgi:hypothetical protein
MSEQKSAGWVFCCIVVLTVILLYVLAAGPACWLSSRWGAMGIVSHVYRPVTWVAEISGSDRLMAMLQMYSALGSTEDSAWGLNPDTPGEAEWTSGWFPISTGGTIVLPLRAGAPPLAGDAEAEEP